MKTFLRRTVWTLIVLVTITSLFYAEEDWRGARALRSVKADYKRAGISLDFKDYVPKPIPDSENLGALPVFTPTYRSTNHDSPDFEALDTALRNGQGFSELPSAGHWQLGQPASFSQIDSGVAETYAQVFKTSPAGSPLTQFDVLFPILETLRQASLTRTDCRFTSDFKADPPQVRSPYLLTLQIRLSRLLALHALLALEEHQPELALKDLRTILILAHGACRDPSSVGQLVAIVMHTSCDVVVYNGLVEHAWSSSQLAQLQESLARDNFLVSYRFGLETDSAAFSRLFDVIRANPSNWRNVGNIQHPKRLIDYAFPIGWIDLNENDHLRLLLRLMTLTGARNQTLSVEQAHHLFDDYKSNSMSMPWNMMSSFAKDLVYAPRQFAKSQTMVNESVIACAIESYRLAKGRYPVSLNVLASSSGMNFPPDVVNGEPYRYCVQPDGSYLLYSIGWNEKDDGGTVAFGPSDPQQHLINYDQGDWVWFGAK